MSEQLTAEQLAVLPEWMQEEANRHRAHKPDTCDGPCDHSDRDAVVCRKLWDDWPCPDFKQYAELADRLLVVQPDAPLRRANDALRATVQATQRRCNELALELAAAKSERDAVYARLGPAEIALAEVGAELAEARLTVMMMLEYRNAAVTDANEMGRLLGEATKERDAARAAADKAILDADQQRGFYEEARAARAEVARLRGALPPADDLRLIAVWLDMSDPDDADDEMQKDLRRWADAIDAALATPPQTEGS